MFSPSKAKHIAGAAEQPSVKKAKNAKVAGATTENELKLADEIGTHISQLPAGATIIYDEAVKRNAERALSAGVKHNKFIVPDVSDISLLSVAFRGVGSGACPQGTAPTSVMVECFDHAKELMRHAVQNAHDGETTKPASVWQDGAHNSADFCNAISEIVVRESFNAAFMSGHFKVVAELAQQTGKQIAVCVATQEDAEALANCERLKDVMTNVWLRATVSPEHAKSEDDQFTKNTWKKGVETLEAAGHLRVQGVQIEAHVRPQHPNLDRQPPTEDEKKSQGAAWAAIRDVCLMHESTRRFGCGGLVGSR